MPPSFQRINYSIRPAKSIERRMLVESISCLGALHTIKDFRYVGFGSTYFSDFSLIHRQLGISDMISIEEQEDIKERFEFNRPFDCIRIRFGDSATELPQIDWNRPAIVWLDYDGSLSESMLDDLSLVLSRVQPPSFVCISCNAHPIDARGADPGAVHSIRLQRLKDRFPDRVPIDTTGEQLANWGTAKVFYDMIRDEIDTAMEIRRIEDGATFKQILHFHYQDGAKMLTVGGAVLSQDQMNPTSLARCGFEHLPFLRPGSDPFQIEVPCLTSRELRLLDQHVSGDLQRLPRFIPQNDASAYVAIYRYFPLFAELETAT